ncbi:hypothetical protein C1708_31380 [Streptomyces sp. DH-12]|nr:hypothetical protein C1708_31380 [Streptomyces sp. DH-12]
MPYDFGVNEVRVRHRRPHGITAAGGLADTVDAGPHPTQQARLDQDVAQCGYCRPGQITAAVELVRRVAEEGREVTDDGLDGIRDLRRCGTCPRVREAIGAAAGGM